MDDLRRNDYCGVDSSSLGYRIGDKIGGGIESLVTGFAFALALPLIIVLSFCDHIDPYVERDFHDEKDDVYMIKTRLGYV